MGKLVLYLPDGTTRDIRLTKERVIIGRRADNDITLPYPAVSAEHAAIVTVLDDSFLEDLGSTNGTFVNDRSVTKHYLRDRDRLDIGREILVYYSDDNAESEPLPAELLEHDRGSILEPLGAHLSALSEMAKSRAIRAPRGTEPRPVVAEFDPLSTSPMTGQIATEFDSVGEGVDDTQTQRTRPVPARSAKPAPDAAPAVPVVAAAEDPPTPAPPAERRLLVRVLDGPSAGLELEFAKAELVVGRVGLQVAALRREGEVVRLVPLDGATPPLLNGAPISVDGCELHPGDMFEVAGTTLSLAQK